MLDLLFGRIDVEVMDARATEQAILHVIRKAQEGEQLWLISPYASYDKLGTIRREIEGACDRKVEVFVVVRDEPEQTDGALAALRSAVAKGLELLAVERLHAKIYWSTSRVVFGSANLLDGSFDKSVEIGFKAKAGSLHERIGAFIDEEVAAKARKLSSDGKRASVPRKPPAQRSAVASRGGHCIRCAAGIPLNVGRPYCREHYEAWAKYKNPDYKDAFCHGCGAKFAASMARPLCPTCYRSA